MLLKAAGVPSDLQTCRGLAGKIERLTNEVNQRELEREKEKGCNKM